MNTMNVNGQNGVATSAAIKNAVVKAVKMINKAENAKRGYVMIGEGTRLSFDGQRFIKEGKDNFIFNGWIEYKGSNGRYYEVINVSYKNLDNEEGLCLNDMVNAVIDSILNYIDSTIVKCEGSDFLSTSYAETLQLFRYCYFGSKLVVDNTDNLNSPDTLNNDIESIMEFFGNDYKALNDIENEFFGYHFDIDNELRDNLLFKRNGTFIDMYYNNMDIINNSEYIRLTDIKNIRDFENALYELISSLINDNENEGADVSVVDQVVNFIVEKESGDNGVCYLYDIGYKFSCFDWKVDKELIEAWHGPIQLDIKEYSDVETYCINLLDNNGYEIGYIDMDQVDTWEDFQIEIENQLECIRAHINDMIEGFVSLDKSVVMEAFEIADAQGESSLKIDYEDWWESFVLTPMYDIYDSEYIADYMYSNYFEGFCENLLEQFKMFAKDYGYVVEKTDNGIYLEKNV